MRKKIIVLTLAAGAALAALSAPKAEAQAVSVTGITAFSPLANYMSLPGFYRMRVYQTTGQWISREAAVQAVADQGAPAG